MSIPSLTWQNQSVESHLGKLCLLAWSDRIETDMDEPALISAAQKGDLDSFNTLVLHYQHQVYNLAYRIMGDDAAASDATQEAFISAWRHLSGFRGGSYK